MTTPADDLRTPDDSDHAPNPFDLRQHEMRDLRHQGAGPADLWTADTVPTEEYL